MTTEETPQPITAAAALREIATHYEANVVERRGNGDKYRDLARTEYAAADKAEAEARAFREAADTLDGLPPIAAAIREAMHDSRLNLDGVDRISTHMAARLANSKGKTRA